MTNTEAMNRVLELIGEEKLDEIVRALEEALAESVKHTNGAFSPLALIAIKDLMSAVTWKTRCAIDDEYVVGERVRVSFIRAAHLSMRREAWRKYMAAAMTGHDASTLSAARQADKALEEEERRFGKFSEPEP